jgi:hypothetical protein
MREIKFRAWDKFAKMMTDDGNRPTGPHMKYDVGLIPSDAPHDYTYGIDGLQAKAFNESSF